MPANHRFSITTKKLEEILQEILVDVWRSKDVDEPLSKVVIHSGNAKEGSVFVALPGRKVDGNDYILDAIRNGASAVICERPPELSEEIDCTIYVVASGIAAIEACALYWRQYIGAMFIAVSGTAGKTITKDALGQFLGDDLSVYVYVSPVSYNSPLGVMLSILRCPSNVDVAVIECAITEVGHGERYHAALSPGIVVIPSHSNRWRSAFASIAQEVNEYRNLSAHSKVFVLEGVDCSAIAEYCTYLDESTLSSKVHLSFEQAGENICVSWGSGSIEVLTGSHEIAGDIALARLVADYVLNSRQLPFGHRNGEQLVYVPTISRLEQWRAPNGAVIVRDMATADPVALRAGIRVVNKLAKTSPTSFKSISGRTIIVLRPPREMSGSYDDEALSNTLDVLISEKPDLVLVFHARIAEQLCEALSAEGIQLEVFGDLDLLREWLINEMAPGDAVLVQSGRGQWIEDTAGSLISAIAPNRLYIDLDAVEQNLRAFRQLIGPRCQIVPMVKALAYGTDPEPLVLAFESLGIETVAVSTVHEGVRLRRRGVATDILVMLPQADDLDEIQRYRLTPVAYSMEFLKALLDYDGRKDYPPIRFHLEVDTGMHRTGVQIADLDAALGAIQEAGLELLGVMTHFACADDPDADDFTRRQIERFAEVKELVAERFGKNILFHAAATAGAIRFPGAHLDMVRIGLGLFGIYPSEACRDIIELSPVLSLSSRIVELSEVNKGEFVGYGATYVAEGEVPRRIAVVPAGYYDCIPRALSNQGVVEVTGKVVPIVGRVSMDSMTIDVSDVPDVEVGTEVTIYGRGNASIEAAAKRCDTIPYELMTRIGGRVERIFTSHGVAARPN